MTWQGWQDKGGMTRTYSQMHPTDQYSEHSSIIWLVWLNGWVSVYGLSSSGFKSGCNHLSFRFCTCFEQGVPSHSAKLRPKDVLRTSPKDVPWMSPYGPLCNAKGSHLATSWGRPLPTSFGCWNMTFWARPNITSWGRPHNVLYVTPRHVPCRRLEDGSCRR